MRWLLLAGALVVGACGEDPLEGELIWEPEPAAAQFDDTVVALTLFEYAADDDDGDGDGRPIELFVLSDVEMSPLSFDLEPKIIHNDRDYFVTVHADMNGNQRIDRGDYVNRAFNTVFDGFGPVTIVLSPAE